MFEDRSLLIAKIINAHTKVIPKHKKLASNSENLNKNDIA
jgi:hypothetical protein